MHGCIEAYEAVTRAAAERAALRRRNPADRDSRLVAVLDDLSAAMAPLRAELLRAPKATARFHAPEVRAASAALQRERRLVRGMLQRRPGGRRSRPTQPRVRRPQAMGAMAQLVGTTRVLDTTVQRLRKQRAGARRVYAGYDIPLVLPIRGEAAWVVNEIKDVRARLRRWERRVERVQTERWEHDQQPPEWTFEFRRRGGALREWLVDLERLARRLAKLKPKPPRKTPVRRGGARKWGRLTEDGNRQPWDAESALRALGDWSVEHGRPPTARDLTGPYLPSWGTVRKLLGGMPASGRLVPISTSPTEG